MTTEVTSIDIDLLLKKDNLASEIVQKWDTWDNRRTNWKGRVNELKAYLFATSANETTNAENEHDHSSHRPKLTQIYDTLKSIYVDGLLSGGNFFQFRGEDESNVAFEKRRRVEAYLRTKHRQNGFKQVIGQLVDDWMQTGNAIASVDYVSEKLVNEDGAVFPGYVGPVPIRQDPFDIAINPAARNWDLTPKIVRVLTDLGSLSRKVKEHPEGSKYREVVQRSVELRGAVSQGVGYGSLTYEDMQKYFAYEMDGFGTYSEYLESSVVEILVYYGDIFDPNTGEFLDRRRIEVIDRNWILEEKRIETWNGKPNLFKTGWRDRPNNLWSMSPLENIVGLQFRINHLENTRADQFDDLANQDLLLVGDVEESYDRDGRRRFRVTEGGTAQYLRMDNTVLNADLQIAETERAMEVYAGVPREAAGFRTPGEKTKFESETMLDSSTRMFINKLEKFEDELLEPLLLAEVEVARRSIGDATVSVEAIDDDTGATEFLTITRADLTVSGRLVPIGSRFFEQQAKAAKELASFQNILAQDKEVAEHVPSLKLAKLWERALGLEDTQLVQPHARIAERLQGQRQAAAAQQLLEAETDASDIGDDVVDPTDIIDEN